METKGIITDARAALLLCTSIGLVPTDRAPSPLSAREWRKLCRNLDAAGIGSAAELAAVDGSRLDRMLGQGQGRRIKALLRRGRAAAREFEALLDRGVRVLTQAHDGYPRRWLERLGHDAPPVVFFAGRGSLLDQGGLAVVGSRAVDRAGAEFAERIGRLCAEAGIAVISGGARGVDRAAMFAALGRGGSSVGVIADSLEANMAKRDIRRFILDEALVLVTAFHPRAGFSAANAMARNRLIYALADRALVVASDKGRGGTWGGSTQALRQGLVPILVRDSDSDGNRELIRRGAAPFPPDFQDHEFEALLAAAVPKAPPSRQIEMDL